MKNTQTGKHFKTDKGTISTIPSSEERLVNELDRCSIVPFFLQLACFKFTIQTNHCSRTSVFQIPGHVKRTNVPCVLLVMCFK